MGAGRNRSRQVRWPPVYPAFAMDDDESRSGPPAVSRQELPAVRIQASRSRAFAWFLTGLAMCLGGALPGIAMVGSELARWSAGGGFHPGTMLLALALGGALAVPAILLFGYVAWMQLREVLAREPRFVLDEEGFRDRQLGLGTVPWDDVEDAKAMAGTPHVYLYLRDPVGYLDRVPLPLRLFWRYNRGFGLPPFLVNTIGTGIEAEELAAEIRARARGQAALPATALPPGKKTGDSSAVEDRATSEDWISGG